VGAAQRAQARRLCTSSQFRPIWQVHAEVPLQASVVPVRQAVPVQQGVVGEQAWPSPEQVAPAAQRPVLAPEGMTQLRPTQQSCGPLHPPSAAWQTAGAWQAPPEQMPEQHWLPEVHMEVLERHTGTPASGVRGGSWQALPPSSDVARQSVPAQQVDASVHDAPMPAHVGLAQTRPPSVLGRQSAPSQQASLKSQGLP
jgi:hypothetical protein